jgi:hypothetical protein
MVIYAVNLLIESAIYAEFHQWLPIHVEEILQLPGFIKALILKPEEAQMSGFEALTVQYHLQNRAYLEDYLTCYAESMRAEAISRFSGKFTATRVIYEVEDNSQLVAKHLGF